MGHYLRKDMARLGHQLKLSPRRRLDSLLDGAERLAGIIEPHKTYPYDFVCYRITGYHKAKGAAGPNLPGKDLLADLAALVDELSGAAPKPIDQAAEELFTATELAKRLKVSTKTISRWRRRGLIGRRYRLRGGKMGLVFSQSAVERFVETHRDLVRRAAAFRQLTSEERARIVGEARRLLGGRRMRLHEVAQEVSAGTGRAVETIRYTLKRHDRENPRQALFARDQTPQVCPEHRRMFQAYLAGDSACDIARALGKPQEAIADLIDEMRCRRILDRPLDYIYSPEFDAPDAEQTLLSEDLAEAIEYLEPPSSGGPGGQPYIHDLARLPVLSPQQERDLFRQYNYLKFRAAQLREQLDPLKVRTDLLESIEQLLARIDKTNTALVRCNLRLVMNIAKRHVGNAPDLLEVVSDGNISLMRAVEKFDYTRGYKFSTYATWAIMRNYARTIPQKRYQRRRYQTGAEEILQAVPGAAAEAEAEWERKSLREKLGTALNRLDQREREVVRLHFGLTQAAQPRTLEQIGQGMGVTKERVRQIERRALDKLRQVLPVSLLDLVSE